MQPDRLRPLDERRLQGCEVPPLRHLDEQPEGQRLVHNRLPDIEYAGVVFGEDAGEQCRLTGVVVPGEVNQYSLAQEVS